MEFKYVDNCEPKREGNWYLLFCYKDTLLKNKEKTKVEVWVAIYGWHIRVKPLTSTYVKLWFDTRDTVIIWWKWFEKVYIECRPICWKDVLVKKWDVLSLASSMNWWVVMNKISDADYNKYK